MSELSYALLSEDAVAHGLEGLPGWSAGEMLTKEFTFPSYAAGLVFAVAVGHLADALNHHPDLFIGYQRVRVSLVTHDAGGLTSYDLELALRIESLLA